MDTTVFLCGECGAVVTRPLRRLDDLTRLDETWGGDYEPPDLVPSGFYVLSDDIFGAGLDTGGYAGVSPGEVLFSTFDLPGRHPDLLNEQDIGCCGPHGDRGYNWFCVNGHAIGTEVLECCLVNYARFPLALLRAEPPEDADAPRVPQAERPGLS